MRATAYYKGEYYSVEVIHTTEKFAWCVFDIDDFGRLIPHEDVTYGSNNKVLSRRPPDRYPNPR